MVDSDRGGKGRGGLVAYHQKEGWTVYPPRLQGAGKGEKKKGPTCPRPLSHAKQKKEGDNVRRRNRSGPVAWEKGT